MSREAKLSPKERDAALSRERMRRLRNGSSTTADRAYHVALGILREKHRDEFEGIRTRELRKLERESA